MLSRQATLYPDCRNLQNPPHVKVSKDVADAIGANFRVVPMFEKQLYEYSRKKSSSLLTNEVLKCRWKEYQESSWKRVKVPLKVPDNKDVQFRNQMVKFFRSDRKQQHDFRFKMAPGPGVDLLGHQKPIPNELLLQRGHIATKKLKNTDKNKNEWTQTDLDS